MRYAQLILVTLLVSVALLGMQQRIAYASFHCMRVHAVMAGFQSNDSIQYIELRMSLSSQTLVSGHQIKFYDASGTLKATFTFPSGVTGPSVGYSILIGTQEFNDNTNGGDADFTFSGSNTVGANGGDPLHPIQAPDGKVTFAEGGITCLLAGPPVVGSAAYGSFTGTVDYGSTPAPALPTPSDNRALRLNNLAPEATDNSTEYSLETVSGSTFTVAQGSLASDPNTPRNNSRTVLQLALITPTPTPLPVGGLAKLPAAAAPPLASTGSSGANQLQLAIAAGVSVVAITFLGGSAWYIRKRRQA